MHLNVQKCTEMHRHAQKCALMHSAAARMACMCSFQGACSSRSHTPTRVVLHTSRTPSLRYLTGLWKYKLLVTSVRLLANLLYADAQVSLSRMWQPAANKRQLR